MKFIIGITIVLICTISLSAQNSIKLSGYVDTAFIQKYQSNELLVSIKQDASRNSAGVLFRTQLNDLGMFNLDIPTDSNNIYLSFEFEDKRPTRWTGMFRNISEPSRTSSLREVYLFSKGDQVTINIKRDNSIVFKGKGSEKLNYQYLAYNLLTLPKSINIRILDLENKGELKKAVEFEAEMIRFQIQQLQTLLKTYKTIINEEVYQQLLIDGISLIKHNIIEKLPNYFLRFPSSDQQRIIKQYFITLQGIDVSKDSLSNQRKIKSAFYTSMLLENEVAKMILFSQNRKSFNDFSFAELFNNISSKYSGLFRDKLILLAFKNFVVQKTDETKKQYMTAKKMVKDNHIKEQLVDLMQKYDNEAFPFVFYDVNNKPHKLQDYRGKVIVMDFWFKGCVPCTMVAEAMHPIFEKYKNRKDIVFITVSTDQKEKWLEGVASGLYTSEGMINLHTNGKGFKDPTIVHYNFIGLPQQLIIDKKGQLVTASPPRPDVGEVNLKAFEKLIEQNLRY